MWECLEGNANDTHVGMSRARYSQMSGRAGEIKIIEEGRERLRPPGEDRNRADKQNRKSPSSTYIFLKYIINIAFSVSGLPCTI